MPVPRNLPPHAKESFESVMESLRGKVNPRTGQAYTDEARGRIAWAAVKKKYKKVGTRWVKKKAELKLSYSGILSTIADPSLCDLAVDPNFRRMGRQQDFSRLLALL